MALLEAFQRYVAENDLATHDDRILLTVSGGVDSMVMLSLFTRSGYSVGVAHCNFQLRGAESDEDEVLVADSPPPVAGASRLRTGFLPAGAFRQRLPACTGRTGRPASHRIRASLPLSGQSPLLPQIKRSQFSETLNHPPASNTSSSFLALINVVVSSESEMVGKRRESYV